MEEIVYKAEPKHHFVLKVILSIFGIVVVGAVLLVIYKGNDVPQAVTTSMMLSDSMQESSGSEELINGIPVPPEPDSTINNATLAGVDSNSNGVRDDVERILAGASNKSTFEAQTLPIAQLYQELATSKLTSPEEVVSLTNKIYCLEIKRPPIERQLFSAEGIKYITNNTPGRVSSANANEVLVTAKPALIEGSFSCPSLEAEVAVTINGISVPPEPDPTINNATLAGVDSNSNGVRDDIDRTIARQFGGTPDYSFALAYARQYQQLITSPIPSERNEALIIYSRVMCTVAGSSESVYTFKVDSLTANTPAREQVLRDFLDVLVGFGSRELQPCAN